MKKLIITESERNNIRTLYYEQDITKDLDVPDKNSSFIEKFLYLSDKLKSDKKDDSKTTEDSSSDDYLNNTSSGSVDSKWMKVTKKVIDKLEGGYWNGSTPKNEKTSKFGICGNHPNGSMGASTETLFGLDRYNGSIEKTPEGQEFFRIIDKQKKDLGMSQFCKKWKWGYRGGDLEDKLKTLAAKIMKNSFDRNMRNFVKSPELKKRIENNDRLLMHFSYASWNGPGFFQQFARSMENAVKEGKSDKELLKQAIADRKNSRLLRQDNVAKILTDPNLNLA